MFAIARRFATLLFFAFAAVQGSALQSVRAQVVFSTNFETGLPAAFSAPGAAIEPVQGWSGLGPPERQFSGSFLRYTSLPILTTTLTLNNLPPHDTVDLRFLLAVIDSWDGVELLEVSVDGTELFSHWFQLGSGDWSSYVAAPGALLSSGTDLGFTGGPHCIRDRAYDLGVEPVFLGIPHTSSSLVVTWTLDAVSGPGAENWQGGDDESWAIDEVSVEVSNSSVDAPLGSSVGGIVLDGAWPNPSRDGSFAVHFALPNNSAATFDLFDVAGRLVDSRPVGFMGAGSHHIETSQVQPGVYFLRLSQGSDVKLKRAVVLE
jgi:hypothetical protein